MLKRLFSRTQAKSPKESTLELAPGLLEAILNTVGPRSIPTMPRAAQRAFELSTDPNADAKDFIEILESDESLSARVIKIANSVFFDRGNVSSSIEDAVHVIGLNELRCLLNATTLSELFPSKHPARTQAWANDIATALIARKLAPRFFPNKVDLAFLGGLMHDIGKLLLIQRAFDQYNKVLKLIQEKELTFSQAEEQIFPFDHTQVGQLIAQRWNFTTELIEIIRYHHSPLGNEITMPSLIGCANTLAHAFGLGHTQGFHKLRKVYEAKLAETWAFLKIPDSEAKEITRDCTLMFQHEYELYAVKN